ncbi:MAG: 50S ribosomal protein L11 methyltransferase [Desulfobacterales bacterium]|nr:50S ribosomal protein L11 methyltransferase [Desulfobacterales bacterium]
MSLPYNQPLYIYYLQGRVGQSTQSFGESFLGNWEEDGYSFLFFSKPVLFSIEQLIEKQNNLILLDTFEMTYEEWQGGRIEPMQIGSFFLYPPWTSIANLEIPNSCIPICLDPGLVFGTGMHPTTHVCLNLLEYTCRTYSVVSGIDIGTGTGILSIAAAKLGCQEILAIDSTFLAATTTKNNVIRNELSENILVIQGLGEHFIDHASDILIANIHYDVMKKLVHSQGFLQNSFFILSGLLKSQAQSIEAALHTLPVQILEKQTPDGIWYSYLGKQITPTVLRHKL